MAENEKIGVKTGSKFLIDKLYAQGILNEKTYRNICNKQKENNTKLKNNV